MKSPPGDTVRVLSWDELPASVREIPQGIDPLADGILMAHQVAWLRACRKFDLTIAEKGRRTGITYATALDSAITAATKRSAGGDNVFYIGDTKDKGLEFIGYCAHMAKVMAQAMAEGWQGIEVFLFEDQQPDGTSKNITAYRMRFASGFQIVALSSNPANIRGLQGVVVIDEAAFHSDVQKVIDAATALIIWGGKIRIISTHNGAGNPFNQLVKDSRAGIAAFEVFFCSFDDAVKNGLFERVCMVKGWTPTVEKKAQWYNKIRGGYGANKAAMREELDVIPREGSGVAIPGMLIENCMHEPRPVVRLALDNDFAIKSEVWRKSWTEAWINAQLTPLLAALDPERRHVFGQDFARHGDFSVIAPGEILPNLSRRVPFIVELKNVPTRQQEQILWHIIERLPRFYGGAMDASGNGETIAEFTADKFGRARIDEVKLSDGWYRSNMMQFRAAFEDQALDLPRDDDIKNDLRALQLINGIIKLPSLRTSDTKNSEFKRHGDAAIALAMMDYAARRDVAPIEWTPAPTKASRWDGGNDDGDNDFDNREGGAW